MRAKGLTIMAGAAVVAVAAAAWIVIRQAEQTASSIGDQGPLFPALAQQINDVGTLMIADAKQSFTIQRQGEDRWVLKEKADYRVRDDAVKKAVVGIAELQILEPRSENPELHQKMGVGDLDKPGSEAVRITLKDKASKDLASLLIGKTKASETTMRPAEIFVRKASDTKAWLVHGRLEVKADPMSWVDKETFKVVRGRIMSVEIAQPDGAKAEIRRTDPAKEEFELVGLPKDKKAKVSDVNGIAGGLEFVNFDDVAKADAVDFSKAVVATYRTYDGLVLEIRTVKKDGKPWVNFKASVDAAQVAKDLAKTDEKKILLSAEEVEKEAKGINDRLGAWAHQVPDYRSDNFTRKPDDLIIKDAS
ncbi:DUF4340 domain-containing protein [Desertibaculum subflavum]|uniref:DUF4340 domain-containing protein n=1 Tax=Desertibaculum subflavum TaxID=2268458 RepID=UPI000E670C43